MHDHCNHHCSHHTPLKTLIYVTILTGVYMIVEFVGGWLANSLALIADAGHMLTDVGSLGLAVFAAWFAQHPATLTKTYGYYRIEILAAFLNSMLLIFISGFVLYEAFERLYHPEPVQGALMLWVAAGGLLVNIVAAFLLHRNAHDNMNVRAAFLHVLSDMLGSIGAIIAGWLIWQFHWLLADVVISALIALLVFINAVGLLKEAVHILLEGVPSHISVEQVLEVLKTMDEVEAVHDLHIWSITMGQEALSAHIVVKSINDYRPDVVDKVQDLLQTYFGLNHCTIQLEVPGQHHEHDLTCAQQLHHMHHAHDHSPPSSAESA